MLEAENEQLQDQLREVRDENCRLYKLVSEKDFEIIQLQKRVQDERLALSGKHKQLWILTVVVCLMLMTEKMSLKRAVLF